MNNFLKDDKGVPPQPIDGQQEIKDSFLSQKEKKTVACAT